MTSLKNLYEKLAGSAKSAVAVACAEDSHVLEAVSDAREMANFVLIGDGDKIRMAAKEANANIDGMEIVNEPNVETACAYAVKLVSEGKADALMKGLVDTSIILKAVLKKEAGMRTGRTLSHLAVFEMPTYHKLLFVTDAAINIAPDLNGKREILQNAVEAVNNLGIVNPKVALLAAKEKADPKMPVTMDAVELKAMNIANCIMDGPLALDNAVSKESAEIKGINSPVAGEADILVCPNIESGNVLYKSLAFLGGGKNGGVVLGAKKPIILTSRADSAESKLISIALGILSGRN
ncbi:MAG: bifunctional enoyl-CoA hydratase/phosphate acetyltransferase [Defluviitaleaceae bacterium]|nr:bifunctional enoyl-CoA hydratase/phosphate acetyltransferase [Defluviitaleaceae bacterium]